MHFVSIEWFFWMAATFGFFWLFPAAWRHYFLVAITLAFLVVHAPESALVLTLFTGLAYGFTRRTEISGRRAGAICGVVVAVLLAYKLMVAAPREDIVRDLVVPLGLSYYALRVIHYVLERYKGAVAAASPAELISYLFFLPTIVIGPIHRYPAFLRDLRRHRWDPRLISEGLERILYGYVKITIFANYLVSGEFARFVGSIDPEQQALILYLEIVRGGLNLYLQFSGFSDVAIGFARLLGFRVMENFDWPYFKTNISDFWRSWHMSLTSWCREYIYTTVFSISRSPALGAIATLVTIGIWHEVSLRYLVWGIYHGLGIVAWQQFRRLDPYLPAVNGRAATVVVDALKILLTVHFVWFGFVIVRQPTLEATWKVFTTVLFFWM